MWPNSPTHNHIHNGFYPAEHLRKSPSLVQAKGFSAKFYGILTLAGTFQNPVKNISFSYKYVYSEILFLGLKGVPSQTKWMAQVSYIFARKINSLNKFKCL